MDQSLFKNSGSSTLKETRGLTGVVLSRDTLNRGLDCDYTCNVISVVKMNLMGSDPVNVVDL